MIELTGAGLYVGAALSWELQAGHKGKLGMPVYLRNSDGNFTCDSPFRVNYASRIEGIVVSEFRGDMTQSFTIAVAVNGVDVITITKPSTVDRILDDSVSVTLDRDDRIDIRVISLSGIIRNPTVTLTLSEL